MAQTLQPHGDTQAVVIDKSVMDAAGITMDTPLEIDVRDGGIVIRPAKNGISRDAMSASLEKLYPRYEQMLNNLECLHEGLGREKVAALLAELRPQYKQMLQNLAK